MTTVVEGAPHKPKRRLLDRARIVVPLLLIVGALVSMTGNAAIPLSNFDTYFHLRFGHEFWAGWSLRDPGSVSTLGTNDWVPTQWLPQMVIARLEDWFGLPGVAWFSGLQQVALCLTFYLCARRWADPLVAAPVTIVALLVSSPGLSMRPQVISYLLVAVTAAAWASSARDGRARWWLIPMTWVWAMYHGMWPVGLVIGAVSLVGIALDRAATRRQWLAHLMVVLGAAAAAALTPVGPRLYPAVLLVNSRSRFFGEWQAPEISDINFLILLALLAIVAICMFKRTRNSWLDIGTLLLAGGFGIYSGRTVVVAGALLVPLAASVLQGLLGPRSEPDRPERWVVGVATVACLAGLAAVVPHTSDEPPDQPAWVDVALADLPSDAIVLNDWGWGGYLIWRYPDVDFVMNGYGDIFTESELQRNYDIGRMSPGWDNLVRGTGAEFALVPPNSALAYGLRETEGWRVVHHSADIELLEKP